MWVIICFWALFMMFFLTGAGAATLTLTDGWNLVSTRVAITVADTFADSDHFTSVWKWKDNSWAVYLPGESPPGEYAGAKGFNDLSTIDPGEGFWVNSKAAQNVAVTGTEQTGNTLSLAKGWNLAGLPISSAISVSDIFSDSSKFTSIWKWENNQWAVYLPGETTQGTYAASKGFNVLTTISDGEGFWVNAQTAATADLSGAVETPPLVGKVQEVIGKNDKNAYKAVPGALVVIDGAGVGKTDSQGAFQTTSYDGSSVQVEVTLSGYVPFKETVTIPDSKQIYIFIQKQDTSSETLKKTGVEGVSKILPGSMKPTPKTIASSDSTTSLKINHMTLDSDITVAVTPFNSTNTIPDTGAIADLGLGKVDIVGGGTVSAVDSSGTATTGAAAGFTAQVEPKTTRILGKWTLDKIATRISGSDTDKLYLLSKTPSGWKKVGEARIEQKENSSVKYMLPKSGVIMTTLDAFLFVLTTPEEQAQVTQVAGKIVKKGTEEGIPGVYVGVDAFFAEDITDSAGNFALDFHIMDAAALGLKYLFIYAYRDGYRALVKEIAVPSTDTVLNSSGPITLEMEPFSDAAAISGHVFDPAGGPVQDAMVILKTPSVLDEIKIEEDKVYVGKAAESLYKWVVMDESENVLKTIQAKGKNFIGKDDIGDLFAGITQDTVFLVDLEVTHKAGEKEFREHGMGLVFVHIMGDQKQMALDLMPDFTHFSIMEAWTDEQGAYQFYDVEKELVPFLKIAAKKPFWPEDPVRYQPSSFELLAAPGATGPITKDISLQVQTKAADYFEGFETGADGWTVTVESGETEITTPNTTWNLLQNPEQVVLSPNVLNIVRFEDMGWIDAEGTIGTITVNQDQSDDNFTAATAPVVFLENNETRTLQVELHDLGEGTDGPPDGLYDVIWLADPEDELNYALWYDFDKYPPEGDLDEFLSMNLVEGSKVMVSYQGVDKQEGEVLSLLPALPDSGDWIYWLGNKISSDYKGTYYDPDLNTGENIVTAILESPTIDLTDFSFATLFFNNWFEINGANFSSMTLEVALMDENLGQGESVTLEAAYGDVTIKKGEFVPIFQFNPFISMGLDDFAPPPEDTAPLQKTALPEKGLFQTSFADEDGDDVPDDWMDTDPCDPNDPGGDPPVLPDQPAIGLTSGGEAVPPVWTPYEFNLAPFAGHQIALRFKFGFVNQNTNLFRGCAIDDIRIQDEESGMPFEIMTPEFGYFRDYHFEEIPPGDVWTGYYLLSFTEGFQQNVFEDPTGTPAEYNPAPQPITVSQQEDWVQTEIIFAGVTCTLEGNFWNPAYDYLNFWFYDTETEGMTVSGWGEIFLDPETEERSGFIDGQDNTSGMRYWGDINLTPQP